MASTEKLFSYGTLRYADVQRATFGRTLTGKTDTLPGYIVTMHTIDDPHVLALSKESQHPMLRPSSNPDDKVDGMVFNITADELAQADLYEVDSYQRVAVTLSSGTKAWAYVSAA